MDTTRERAPTAPPVTSAEPGHAGTGVLPWIASLFTLKTDQFHPLLGLIVAVIVIGPQFLLKAAGHQELALSFSFGVLFTGLSDLAVRDAGVSYATRVRCTVAFVLIGMLLTALGYLLGGASWILVTLAVVISTLLSMLAAAYGNAGATSGGLINIWFVIALSVSASLNKTPAQTWPLVGPQTLAWLVGGALWLVVAAVQHMLRQARQPTPARAAQTSAPAPAHLSRLLVGFAFLAAVAVGAATAVAWGLDLPNADWMVVAAIVAMKPSLQASAYAGAQRVAGAILGSLLAALLLNLVHDRLVLVVLLILLLAVANAIHDVNYAFYYTASSAAVLIALGLPHPGSWTDIWQRMGWTLAGVGIALEIMLLAGLASQQQSQPATTAGTAAPAPPPGSIARTPPASGMAPRLVAPAPQAAQWQIALRQGQAQLAIAFAEAFPRQLADYHMRLHQTMERVLHLSGALDLLSRTASTLGVPAQPQALEYIETTLTTWEDHNTARPQDPAGPDSRRNVRAWTVQQVESATTHFRGYTLELPGKAPVAICLGYVLDHVTIFALRSQEELDRLIHSAPFPDLFQLDLPIIRAPTNYLRVPLYDVEVLKPGPVPRLFVDRRHPPDHLLQSRHEMRLLSGPNVLESVHILVPVGITAGTAPVLSVADLAPRLSELQQELSPQRLATLHKHLAAQLGEVLHNPDLWHALPSSRVSPQVDAVPAPVVVQGGQLS